MIGYTFVKGRGIIHAYGFTASTEALPYAAPWSSGARAADTRGNQPVVELQAAQFGELIMIFSQIVRNMGRDFGYTQYIHPVLEEADQITDEPAKAMTAIAPHLVFFNDYLTTEEFLKLDDDANVSHRKLEPLSFTVPTLPEMMSPECDKQLLSELLADVWKACDARINGSKDVAPVRITVCDEQNAEHTLELGRLFVAKTLIPNLPAPVADILSVTIGAEWSNVNNYTGTACCVAQHRQQESAVGYNVFSGQYANHLSQEDQLLGMALITGKHLNYYQNMLNLMGVCPLCADYQVAQMLVVLHKYLSMENRVMEDLDDCSRLWQYLSRDILARYPMAVDDRLCRQILLPIETDILLLQANLSRDNAISHEVYSDLVRNAFSMRRSLDDGKVDLAQLREAYASVMALPPRFEGISGRPFVVFIGDSRRATLLLRDVPLFMRALDRHLATYDVKTEADADTLTAIQARLSDLEKQDADTLRQQILKPYVMECIKAGQNQQTIVKLCQSFGLDFANFRDAVLERAEIAIADPKTSDDELISYFRFAELAGDTAMHTDMIRALDAGFERHAANWDDVERYMGLCRQLHHMDETALHLIWAYMTQHLNRAPLSEERFAALVEFCREADLPKLVEQEAWKYFATIELSPRTSPDISAQMTQMATAFPGILGNLSEESDPWNYFRSEKTTDGMKIAFDKVQQWNDLAITLPKEWKQLAGLTYLPPEAWGQLPQLIGPEKLDEMARTAYQHVMGSFDPQLKDLENQLNYVMGERDWLRTALAEPVCTEILHRQKELWKATMTLDSAKKLNSTLNRADTFLVTKEKPDATNLMKALRLLMDTDQFITRCQNMRGWPEASLMQYAEKQICNVGTHPEGKQICLILRNKYLSVMENMTEFTRLMVGCLLYVHENRRRAEVEWTELLANMQSRLYVDELEHTDPWSAQGMPVLRTLLLILRFTDALFANTPEMRTLGFTLQSACPRFTNAVRSKSKQKKHLPRLFDERGALIQSEAVRSFSPSAVSWMFSK